MQATGRDINTDTQDEFRQSQRARPPIALEYARMSDERPPDTDPPPGGGGVFANLPDARPGTRSPRRDSARAGRAKPKPEPATKPEPPLNPRAAREPERPKSAPKPPPEPEPAEEPAHQGGGLEDIAWAGVAAAAEAATIGVRLASRAIEALRGSPEKE
jgi:hypothetical protein